jgi:hypothetical protein
MTTLSIKDLYMAKQLDSAQVGMVQGGMIKEERPEVLVPGDEGGPAGANVPAIWNHGVDGPIIIWR